MGKPQRKNRNKFCLDFSRFLVHPPTALAAAFQRQMCCLVLSIYKENMQTDRKIDGVTIAGIILKLCIYILLNGLSFKLYYSAFSLYSLNKILFMFYI